MRGQLLRYGCMIRLRFILNVAGLCVLALARVAGVQAQPSSSPARAVDMDGASEQSRVQKDSPPAVTQVSPDAEDQNSMGQLGDFELDRGVYVAAVPFGVSFSMGGVNGISGAQPYWNISLGIDFDHRLSLQGTLSGFYILDNPISVANVGLVDDYSLTGLGLDLIIAARPVRQLALEPRISAGVMQVYPLLVQGPEPTSVYGEWQAFIGGGLDVEYLTLLTGFSAGASLTISYVLEPRIPVLGAGLMVRYTL